jgi:hypothetical protein
MINLPDVDPIVVDMRSKPFDPDNTFFEIYGDNQPIRVASYIEHNPVARDYAGGRVTPFEVSRI